MLFKYSALAMIFFKTAMAADVSLEQYLSEVKKANPGLQSADFHAKALKQKISPAGTWDDPFIAIGKDEIPFDGGMGAVTRLQLSQSIPFPGKLGIKSDIAEYKALSAESDKETLERETTLFASQVFFRLYFNQKSLELNENLKKLVESSVQSARIRYQSGTSEHHDWLLGRVQMSLLDVDRFKLMRENKSLTAIYNELRNESVSAVPGVLKFQFSNESFNETYDFKSLPELKAIDLSVSQYSSELRLAKFSYAPDFVIQGMMMKPDPEMMDEKKNWGFMVGINLPLYFWRKQSDLVSSATFEKQSAEMEKRRLENRLHAEEIDAREQFNSAKDVVELYQKSVLPSTELAVENAKSGYVSRKLPLNQYIDTLKIAQTQKLELVAAQIDVEFAKLRMKNLVSSTPLFKLAPGKPSLIGAGMGSSADMSSDNVNMGGGMKAPTPKTKDSSNGAQSSGGGMGNM